MDTPAAGVVVLVSFPFTNLAQAELRPAIVLPDAGRGDWILCQTTSNPYADPHAVELTAASFAQGSLRITSYARPCKLFNRHPEISTLWASTHASRKLIGASLSHGTVWMSRSHGTALRMGIVSGPGLKRDLFCTEATKRELSIACNSTCQAGRGESGYGLQKDKTHD